MVAFMRIDLTKHPLSKKEIEDKIIELKSSIIVQENNMRTATNSIRNNLIIIGLFFSVLLMLLPDMYFLPMLSLIAFSISGIFVTMLKLDDTIVIASGIVVFTFVGVNIEKSIFEFLIVILGIFWISAIFSFYDRKISKSKDKKEFVERDIKGLQYIDSKHCLEIEQYIKNKTISEYHKNVVIKENRKFTNAEVYAMKVFIREEEKQKSIDEEKRAIEESCHRLYVEPILKNN